MINIMVKENFLCFPTTNEHSCFRHDAPKSKLAEAAVGLNCLVKYPRPPNPAALMQSFKILATDYDDKTEYGDISVKNILFI